MKSLRAAPVEINWHSGLPIYASQAFLKAVGDEYGWIGGTDDSGQLHCVLPYSVIRKPGLRIVRFRVETIPLGGELEVGDEKTFLKSTLEYFRSAGFDMIIPATNNTIFRTYPDGADAAPYGTFIKDLDQPEDVLWSEISEAYRKDIRKAKKSGVQIKGGMEYLKTSYTLTADTLKRSNQKFKSFADFRNMILGLGENVRILVAEHEDVVQACLVVPFSEHSAYTLYGGTVSQPLKGAMHLLHWEAIRQSRGMGVKRFNFTGVRINPERGSKQEGIMTFKMRFGGRLIQGYMWKYSFHPLKFAAYSAAVRLLRGGDIVDQERYKLAGV
jgi:lipid II:glycine glycyltransferase (peptidoglycan interpeptide bridge formation enzyme)